MTREKLILEWDGDFCSNPHIRAVASALQAIVSDTALRIKGADDDIYVLRVRVEKREWTELEVDDGPLVLKDISCKPQFTPNIGVDSIQLDRRSVASAPDTGVFALVAQDSVKFVSLKPVLNTSLVRWLEERRVLDPLKVICILGCLAMFFCNTEDARTGKPAATESGHKEHIIPVMRPWALCLHLALVWFSIFIFLHQAAGGLVRLTWKTFDVLMICFSGLVLVCIECGDRLISGRETGVLSTFSATLQVINSIFVVLPLLLLAVNADAFLIERKVKVLLYVVVLIFASVDYITTRHYNNYFSQREVCSWIHCTPAKNIYLSADCNMIFFICKILSAYLSGRDISTLTTKYRDMTRERTSTGMCFKKYCSALATCSCCCCVGGLGVVTSKRGPSMKEFETE